VAEAGPGSPVPEQQDGPKKRRFRNFLLQPLVQVKLGLYSIIMAMIFSGTVATILIVHLSKFAEIVLALTDVEDEVGDLLNTYMADVKWWLLLAIIVFLVANILVSVLYTHRLVGPTFAFRRHIRSLAEGNYRARTFLRKGDAFIEVADELNNLSEVLERRHTGR
jgi:signal transduction histidine kinase